VREGCSVHLMLVRGSTAVIRGETADNARVTGGVHDGDYITKLGFKGGPEREGWWLKEGQRRLRRGGLAGVWQGPGHGLHGYRRHQDRTRAGHKNKRHQYCKRELDRIHRKNLHSSGDAPQAWAARQHARCADVRAAPTYISASDVAARQAGGVATRDTQPHHITILIFLRPRALANSSDRLKIWQKYRAWIVRRNHSESELTGALIPLNHTKNHPSSSQDSQDARGLFGPKKSMPPTEL
jgi:hypothetical protein